MKRRSTFFGGQGLDWDALRLRLGVAEAQLEDGAVMSAEDARVILDERARVLALPIETRIEADDSEVIVFRVGEETYAVPLENVVEVARGAGITPLPGAERPAVGVMGWRGRILTVLEIGSTVVSREEPGGESRILVVGERRAAFGLVASAIEGVRQIAADSVTLAQDEPAGRAEYVRGITNDAIVVLDVPALIQRFRADT
ncbi:MAG: chemotaxis protein CheW [Anaerolineae bacterium]|nr:chemotaxis protein CheW [Gemmatimonadaceae bacterium]